MWVDKNLSLDGLLIQNVLICSELKCLTFFYQSNHIKFGPWGLVLLESALIYGKAWYSIHVWNVSPVEAKDPSTS